MGRQTKNNGGTLSTTAHNDADTRSGSSCGNIHSLGGTMSVPECIAHKENAAVALNTVDDENPAISPALASLVAQKAFAFSVEVVDMDNKMGRRYGQGGLIQCPSLPTVDGSTLTAKKRKLMAAHRPTPAIKQPSSAARVSAIPVTALHNVLQDSFRDKDYEVNSRRALFISSPFGGDEGTVRAQEFHRHNDAYSPEDAISINFPTNKEFSWKYGWDITTGEVIRKKFEPQTDPKISFEAVDSSFEYKKGHKIGMAVFRNYEFDFTNDVVCTNNDWDKTELSKEDIMQVFGPDNSVNIYTGEITDVSPDQKVFRHDINTFRGCSGAIVFLLDKRQNGLVDNKLYGKAVGIHAGAFEEVSRTADGSVSSTAKFNLAFALRGLRSKINTECKPSSLPN